MTMTTSREAREALDRLIAKARVHLYKPIQIAEILYRDRVHGDIDLADLQTYRSASKRWRDVVCIQLLGRVSTSSAKYQDDVFAPSAIPPEVLVELGALNRATGGEIEGYIYTRFAERIRSMNGGLDYCREQGVEGFRLGEFLNLFWVEPGLRRSIDKVYEIVVYALVSTIIEHIGVRVDVTIPSSGRALLRDFEDLTQKILGLSLDSPERSTMALIHRVGVTNAADRGLDMWSNFGVAIQVKHLSLSLELAESIVSDIRAEHIVIVCKQVDAAVLSSIIGRLGLGTRIQSIITEEDLKTWYDRVFARDEYAQLAQGILALLREEIALEFPATEAEVLSRFMHERGYDLGESSSQA